MSNLNGSELFDIEAFDTLKDVMEDEFKDLISLYLNDSDNRFSALEQAIEMKDAYQVKELAHSFKGASANLAATSLAELCFKLEKMGGDNQLDDAPNVYLEIKSQYALVKEFLETQI